MGIFSNEVRKQMALGHLESAVSCAHHWEMRMRAFYDLNTMEYNREYHLNMAGREAIGVFRKMELAMHYIKSMK